MIVPPGYATGQIPRDYKSYPSGCYAYAAPFPDDLVMNDTEAQERIAEQKANKSSLLDIREARYDILKSLDQDSLGLCWAFSTTKSCMYMMARMNRKLARLSAWWVAGKVVNWRDQGYWGAASLKQIVEGGVPTEALCPSYKSSFDTAETRAEAATRKVTEWWDGTESIDRNRSIMITAFAMGLAPVLDYNHISHSMCGCYIESINPLVVWCDNSWGPSNGVKGLYKLTGSDAIPDGIVVPRNMLA